MRAKGRDALDAERRVLGEDIARLARREVFALTRQTLSELADTSLGERMCAVLLNRLRALDGAARAALMGALVRGPGPVLVRATSELGTAQRDALRQAIDDCGGAHVALRFETTPDAICGIELIANGYKLAWSVADHLAVMEQRVADALGATKAGGRGAPAQAEDLR